MSTREAIIQSVRKVGTTTNREALARIDNAVSITAVRRVTRDMVRRRQLTIIEVRPDRSEVYGKGRHFARILL